MSIATNHSANDSLNTLPTALGAKFTDVSLSLPDNLPFDEWQDLGQQLFQVERCAQWWLGDWARFGERRYGQKYQPVIQATGKAYGSIANAVWVSGQIESSRRRENLSWSHHYEVAGMETEEQDNWLDMAEAEQWTRADLRDALRRERLADERNKHPLPSGKFRVVYADPPWDFDCKRPGKSREIENHYPTMPLEEICKLPVEEISADDAVLFLWTTGAHLAESLHV